MSAYSRGTRVQVFFGETDQVGHKPRYEAILEYLRKEGAAGATVVRGVAGFGANSKIHTAAILRLSLDLPMILTWIDAPGRVARLLPGLRELTGSGIVTVEPVDIASYGGRRLEQLRFDLPVQDVMERDIVSVSVDSSARAAAELLVGREFRALPVVDAEGRLVGVVSSGDLVMRANLGVRLELLSAMSGDPRERYLAEVAEKPVGEIMTRDPSVVRATDTVAAATHLMSERSIKRLPVIDDAGRLVGMIARSDVLRAVGESFPRDVESSVDHPGARTVGEVMRSDAPVVRAGADLATLVDVVVSTRLNRAVVVDDEGRVVGIVSDAEVLRSVDASASRGVIGALMRTPGRVSGSDVIARDLIARDLVTVGSDSPIAEAARAMTESRSKVLCVVDAEGRLLGILDRADLLRAAGDALRELAATGGTESGDGD
jgi:CBS domain-containing protein